MDQEEFEKMKEDIEVLKTLLEDSNDKISDLENIIKDHNHSGTDGTEVLRNEIRLAPSEELSIGNFHFTERTGGGNRRELVRAFMGVGKDVDAADGSRNTQFTIEHQGDTDGSTNQTFFYGYRSPLYFGVKGVVSAGGTVLTQDEQFFKEGELNNAYLLVKEGFGSATWEVHQISSNTKKNIILSNSTFSNSFNEALWIVFVPVYFGSAEYPWRRLYTTEDTSGGIRFGFGDTAGGDNGLLYI
jgi:hypothetical protein